jgi:ATP adenylyltransferase
MTVSELYDLTAARTDDQQRYMEELAEKGICLFCSDEHRSKVELTGKYWYVVRNDFPYEGTSDHYLIVPHAHVSSFDELPDEAAADLWALKRELKERLDPPATATVERSGDMRYNGGSVAHLHVHFVALETAPTRTVKFRVSARANGDH